MFHGKRLEAFLKAALVVLALVAAGSWSGQAGAAKSKVTGVVNVNTATEAQLCLVPGIGKAKAKAIVKYRGKARFVSAKDMLKVKGIGKKLLDKIGPYIVFEGETTIKATKTKSRKRSRRH